MSDNHGNTPAAWTAVFVAMSASSWAASALMFTRSTGVFWVGVALGATSLVVFAVMAQDGPQRRATDPMTLATDPPPRRRTAGGAGRLRGRCSPSAALAAAHSLALHFRDPHVTAAGVSAPSTPLTGLYCPGCGGLRAVNDLTDGHLGAAASSNLLFVARRCPCVAPVGRPPRSLLGGGAAACRRRLATPRGCRSRWPPSWSSSGAPQPARGPGSRPDRPNPLIHGLPPPG